MRIKRTSDGQEFVGPDGPIPAGYVKVEERQSSSGGLGGFLGRVKKNLPELAKSPAVQIAAGLTMPWSRAAGIPGLLTRAAQGGVTSGGLKLLETGSLTQAGQAAGLGALFQGAGEKVFDVGRYFLSAIPHHLFANKSARSLETWVVSHIPSWSGLASGKKPVERLIEWVHGTGEQTLSEKIYKEAIPKLKKALPKTLEISLDHEAAVALGLPLPRAIASSPLMAQGLAIPVKVTEVIEGLPKLRETGGPVYHRTLRQLMGALEDVPFASRVGETAAAALSALRREYKEGMGFIDFSRKSKMLAGNQYSPVAAQRGLTQHYQDLIRSRQMGEELWDIVKGGPPLRTAPNILQSRTHPWSGAILGGALGGLTGLGAGGIHGARAGGGIGSTIGYGVGMSPRYTHVPLAPPTSLLRSLGAFEGGQTLQGLTE